MSSNAGPPRRTWCRATVVRFDSEERDMKAVRFDEFGGPEVLRYVTVPDPSPGPGEVLIRVEAAAVNWSDTIRRRDGAYPFPTPLPFVPGAEVAGTVEALGEGVEGPPVGTPVFALAGGDGSSGYAELAVASAAMVIPRPAHVPAEEAASILVAGGTAMLALREAGALQPGETVLIEGAGGGVGSYAVQVAAALGAGCVIAAAGTPARGDLAQTLGAALVVDYSEPGWAEQVRDATGGRGADVVLETVGAPTISEAFASLAPFGRMVVLGCASGRPGALSAEEQHALFYRPVTNQVVTGFNLGLYFGMRPQVAVSALTDVIELVASGRIQVHVGARFPLADAAEAHRVLESRGTVGKIVLIP